jgi:hypothetical protein
LLIEGIFLTDLTFIEEGNKNFINNLINFEKKRKIANVIHNLRIYQNSEYKYLKIEGFRNIVSKFSFYDSQSLFLLSLKIEPKESDEIFNHY